MSPQPSTRRRKIIIGASIVLVLAIAYGVHRYLRARHFQSTDDAFIEANVVNVSPRVASNVEQLHVEDNMHVRRGDLLVELDARTFAARVTQARADLAAAQAQHNAAQMNVRLVSTTSGAGVQQATAGVRLAQRQLDEARHNVEAAAAQIAVAQAEVVRAEADAARYVRLQAYGAVSKQEADRAIADRQSAVARLQAARQAAEASAATVSQRSASLEESRAALASARAAPVQVGQSRAQAQQAGAQIEQMQAALRQAELDLSYTKLYAPTAGRVTRKSVERGDFVQVGQTLFSIVPDSVYVVANFKETQLRRIRPGQSATIKVDAYPDVIFDGRVQSIQAGSGAAFSLLPPENATGNYVKVVQRVPVKILLLRGRDTVHVLGPGMSVVPTVRIR